MDRTSAAPALSAEAQLLCRCARTSIDAENADAISSLARGNLDWKRFIELAGHHKLLSLVYHSLSRTCAACVPPTVMQALSARSTRNTQHNLRLLAELRRLLGEFQSQGIGVVPFKGLATSAAAYGNLALREAGDIDLLVRQPDMPRAGLILQRLGYAPDGNRTAAQEQTQIASKYCYHLGYTHPQSGIAIEPHWALMPRFYSPPLDDWTRGLWDRLGSQDLFGSAIPAVAMHDLPLLLAVHAGRHLWAQLNWICDLSELVRAQPELDWDKSLASADATGQGRVLRLGLYLATGLLGAKLPAHVARALQRDSAVPRLAAEAKSWLFRDAADTAASDLSRNRFIMKSMDWPRDRFNWVWHQMVARL